MRADYIGISIHLLALTIYTWVKPRVKARIMNVKVCGYEPTLKLRDELEKKEYVGSSMSGITHRLLLIPIFPRDPYKIRKFPLPNLDIV